MNQFRQIPWVMLATLTILLTAMPMEVSANNRNRAARPNRTQVNRQAVAPAARQAARQIRPAQQNVRQTSPARQTARPAAKSATQVSAPNRQAARNRAAARPAQSAPQPKLNTQRNTATRPAATQTTTRAATRNNNQQGQQVQNNRNTQQAPAVRQAQQQSAPRSVKQRPQAPAQNNRSAAGSTTPVRNNTQVNTNRTQAANNNKTATRPAATTPAKLNNTTRAPLTTSGNGVQTTAKTQQQGNTTSSNRPAVRDTPTPKTAALRENVPANRREAARVRNENSRTQDVQRLARERSANLPAAQTNGNSTKLNMTERNRTSAPSSTVQTSPRVQDSSGRGNRTARVQQLREANRQKRVTTTPAPTVRQAARTQVNKPQQLTPLKPAQTNAGADVAHKRQAFTTQQTNQQQIRRQQINQQQRDQRHREAHAAGLHHTHKNNANNHAHIRKEHRPFGISKSAYMQHLIYDHNKGHGHHHGYHRHHRYAGYYYPYYRPRYNSYIHIGIGSRSSWYHGSYYAYDYAPVSQVLYESTYYPASTYTVYDSSPTYIENTYEYRQYDDAPQPGYEDWYEDESGNYDEGFDDGYHEGYDDGYEDGSTAEPPQTQRVIPTTTTRVTKTVYQPATVTRTVYARPIFGYRTYCYPTRSYFGYRHYTSSFNLGLHFDF